LEVNLAKAAAVKRLTKVASDAGLTMIELALGFVLEHPAVSAAIVGPRTVEQLNDQLKAWNTVLEQDVLDAIDQIVHPGVTLSDGDLGYIPPAISDKNLRRSH
jgi:aryl-alcohol dehydrogenase-like predicted oxidoreductase